MLEAPVSLMQLRTREFLRLHGAARGLKTAEGMGFEPMSPLSQAKRLAGARTRPLCDPSLDANMVSNGNIASNTHRGRARERGARGYQAPAGPRWSPSSPLRLKEVCRRVATYITS